MCARSVFAALLMLFLASPVSAETITGRASVIDADTIEIHGERIRILDIDAPESSQPCKASDGTFWRCGKSAALALSDWIGQRAVNCETTKLDRYQRHLARCSIGADDVAVWLASNGWAFAYRDCKCEIVRAAVEGAKASRLGIWAGDVMAPWEWRKALQKAM